MDISFFISVSGTKSKDTSLLPLYFPRAEMQQQSVSQSVALMMALQSLELDFGHPIKTMDKRKRKMAR